MPHLVRDCDSFRANLCFLTHANKSQLELSCYPADVIKVVFLSLQDWWKVEVNDRQGFVPAAYVKKLDPAQSASRENLLDEQGSIALRQEQSDNQ